MCLGRVFIASVVWLSLASLCAGQERTGAAQQPTDPAQAPQTPAQPPPGQAPLRPGQEVAGQEPEGPALDVGPAKLRLGGYLGLTGIYRSTNSGGGPGTSFGSIPYSDALDGNVSQARLTAESSRLSIRVDADFPEARFHRLSGYFEMDFSGTAPGNVAVTSTSAGFRLRNAFAEVQYGESLFISAGQAFSLMTPVKSQVSMWPSDLDLTQAVDTNYVAGLVWGRFPQFRLTWHPSKTLNWAMSVENPEQQIGNAVVTLPKCCASDIEAQYNTGNDQLNVPNLLPDFVTRAAFNPNKAFHVDAGGVLRVFRHTVAPYANSFKNLGGGLSVNIGVKPTDTTRLILQSAFGSGLGRYIGGLVPDVAFHRDGSISPIRTANWVGGVEQKVSSSTSLAAYYSGVSIENNFEPDVDGTFIGYGFPGSPNSNNRKIEELTATLSSLLVTTTNRGSAQFAVQLSWLKREPWFPESGPESAKEFLFFAQLRYNLP